MLPKPSYTYRDGTQTFGTSSKAERRSHAVVSCPSCLTAFAVDSNAITAATNPAFHCSRCDSVFTMAERANASALQPNPAVVSDRTIPREEAPPAKRIEAPKPASSHSSAVKASDFSIGSRPTPSNAQAFAERPRPTAPRAMEPTASPTTTTPPRNSISLLTVQDEEIDFTLKEPRPESYTSHDVAPQPSPLPHPASPAIDEPITASVTEKLFSQGFNILPPQSAARKEPAMTAPRTARRSELTPELPSEERIDEETFQQALTAQQGIIKRLWQRCSARNRSLVLMSAPVVTTLGLLLSLSPLATVSPQSLGSLIEQLSPSMISQPVSHLPPNTLAMKKLAFKFERTLSGETLAVVTGTVVNTSKARLSGVTLEALAFNRRGEVVATSKAPLRSALAKENIAEIALDTVKKFQASLNARSASISPGESVPFTIALIAPQAGEGVEDESIDLAQLRYFSARVFSVN